MAGTMTAPEIRGNGRETRPRDRGGRATLVTEAVQLLSREGIHGMSIGKLAERTGYSKGGIMAHFHDPDGNVLSLIQWDG